MRYQIKRGMPSHTVDTTTNTEHCYDHNIVLHAHVDTVISIWYTCVHISTLPSDSSSSSCSLTLVAGLVGGVLEGDSLKLMLCLFSLARGEG